MSNMLSNRLLALVNKTFGKKIGLDFLYSIIANALPIVVLQLLVYPFLAGHLNPILYGKILTLMGVVNAVSTSLGGSLDNTRLIKNMNYVESNEKGDFNIILLGIIFLSALFAIVSSSYILGLNFGTTFSTMIMATLISMHSYLAVSYRLVVDFKKNILSNIFAALGYLIGVIVLIKTQIWQMAFILPSLMSIIYLISSYNVLNEPIRKTKFFKSTFITFIWILSSSIVVNILNYMDRFILYPMLGAESVTIYSVAVFFGKTLSMIFLPVSGVLLSYFSQSDFEVGKKKFFHLNLVALMMCLFFIFISNLVSLNITSLIYPTIIDMAKPFLFLGNMAAIIGISSTLAVPFVMKYAPPIWFFIINLTYAGIYFLLGWILLSKYGLFGFCIAMTISNLLKWLLIVIIGFRYVK